MLECPFPGGNWQKRLLNLKAFRNEAIGLVLVIVQIQFKISCFERRSTDLREKVLHLDLCFAYIRVFWTIDFYLDELAQVGDIIKADDERAIRVNASVLVYPNQFLQVIASQQFLPALRGLPTRPKCLE